MEITPLDFEKPIVDLEKKIEEMRNIEHSNNIDVESEIKALEEKLTNLQKDLYSNLSRWQIVKIARHPQRPLFHDYIDLIFTDFVELHGDRYFADDEALTGGFATIEEEKVVILGTAKGKDTKANLSRNFGSPRPEGYRKALRLMKLAEKFHLPIITFIDTKGAHPGMDSEERGIGEAIAKNLFEMSILKTPIISIVIGEGGSGGALAIGVSDKVFMMTYSYYSVISPEGCASILWRDAKYASDAAEALKFTSKDLIKFGVIDNIIPEPVGGAHRNPLEAAKTVKLTIIDNLKELKKLNVNKLVEKRYDKFASMGEFDVQK